MNDKCFIPVRHLRRLFSTIKRKYPVNTDDAKKLPGISIINYILQKLNKCYLLQYMNTQSVKNHITEFLCLVML